MGSALKDVEWGKHHRGHGGHRGGSLGWSAMSMIEARQVTPSSPPIVLDPSVFARLSYGAPDSCLLFPDSSLYFFIRRS